MDSTHSSDTYIFLYVSWIEFSFGYAFQWNVMNVDRNKCAFGRNSLFFWFEESQWTPYIWNHRLLRKNIYNYSFYIPSIDSISIIWMVFIASDTRMNWWWFSTYLLLRSILLFSSHKLTQCFNHFFTFLLCGWADVFLFRFLSNLLQLNSWWSRRSVRYYYCCSFRWWFKPPSMLI